ncbi:tyrosine-type recombinase/integrase [Cryobacterium sp. BB736]|uniref:tyrosine-type recombinase/integrase n=1 Tax=Cryobacterium sp. BB736 TaxID=2746963 RepID=UPI0018743265
MVQRRRRAKGDGGLYQIRDGKLWRAVVTDPSTGKPISRTSRTQAGARAKLDELKKQIREHGGALDTATTVSEWGETWLATVIKPKKKPSTTSSYETIVRKWISPTVGRKKVASLKPSDVRLIHRAVLDAGRSTSTVTKVHKSVLSPMLEAARKEGLCARNVAADVDVPTVQPVRKRGALTNDTAFRVLKTAADMEDGTRWWAAILAGLRQGERLAARIEDLDIANGVLHVQWSLDEITFEHGCNNTCKYKRAGSCPERRLKVPDGFEYIQLEGRLCLVRPKSGRVRTVPLVKPLVIALERHLEATKDRDNPHGLIWRHTDGSPWLPYEDEQAWRDLLHTAGVITKEQTPPPRGRKPGTPEPPDSHWARHTTATVLMELGVDPKIVGEIVGHVSVETTQGYQWVSSDAARAAMDKVGIHFAGALEA